MSLVTEQHSMRNPRAVLHWYDDFLCPLCYIDRVEMRSLCSMVFIWSN